MKKKIPCVLVFILMMTLSVGAIAYPTRSVDETNTFCSNTESVKIQPLAASSFDPAWVVGTLFGKIDDPQVNENEYGNLYISFRAIRVFLIGHYYGFGSGPAFIFKKDTNLSFQYGDFPGFKGRYWDHFIFGRYNGL
jgi:hypothetical protein